MKKINTSATDSQRKRNESATDSQRKRNESATKAQHIRYAFAPLLQEFRAHTKKNEARLWMPIETNLISRYEFATLSPQCRYVFVAVLLYCAGNGINEIPLDAKFMSSVLNVDFRTIENSFVELLSKNLLQERKERKEKTDTQTDKNAVPCVDSQNLFQDKAKENSTEKKLSQFSIEECLKYVEICKSKGDEIRNEKALATKLFQTGSSDAFILATLYPERQKKIETEIYGVPVQFTDEPCGVCFGAKLADVDGKGYRACERCRNERGKSTGYEPKGENEK